MDHQVNKIGFHINRTITMTSQFTGLADREEYWAEATVEAVGQTYRLNVKIDGLRDSLLPGIDHHAKFADPDRQNARQLMALYELAQRSTRDFEKCSGVLREVDVSIPSPPGGRLNWTIEEVRDNMSQKLAGYTIKEWSLGLWQAKPRG